ncbi:hypothetical protein CCGE531_28745 (plasmid) [Rhizobium sp. CCGE531]|nr:hypothetical protein CCGE531_28745 [Rhizobium sp. CCGE531]AYG76422.1 hypothetical protein CCGE532_28220 [Rhizobium sp. CCGE532]
MFVKLTMPPAELRDITFTFNAKAPSSTAVDLRDSSGDRIAVIILAVETTEQFRCPSHDKGGFADNVFVHRTRELSFSSRRHDP